jgi:hypothetical protein
MDSKSTLSRRSFLATAAGIATAIPLSGLVCADAQAADLPHLTADDPSAKALAYTNDASGLTPAKDAMFKPGSHCGSCALFQSAQASKDGWGPCAAFPGKAVNSKGWCHAWSGAA